MVKAMIKMTSIVKLEITGMSLFVLKEEHNCNERFLRPKYENKKIIGNYWVNSNFKIEIKKKDSKYF